MELVDEFEDENPPIKFIGDKVNKVPINNVRMNKFFWILINSCIY